MTDDGWWMMDGGCHSPIGMHVQLVYWTSHNSSCLSVFVAQALAVVATLASRIEPLSLKLQVYVLTEGLTEELTEGLTEGLTERLSKGFV